LPFVCTLGSYAGVAGALLAEELLAAAGDVGAAPCVDRADAAIGLVHDDDVVEQLLVDLAAEVGRVNRLFAYAGAGHIEDGDGQHGFASRERVVVSGPTEGSIALRRTATRFPTPLPAHRACRRPRCSCR